MVRPCFLILDPEHAASISTRKLVIETAKHNVITAYDSHELRETLDVFPNVSGVILNANVQDVPCEETAKSIKQRYPAMPVIAVGPPYGAPCVDIDHAVDNFDPQRLLDVLKTIEPSKSSAILQHEEEISQQQEMPE